MTGILSHSDLTCVGSLQNHTKISLTHAPMYRKINFTSAFETEAFNALAVTAETLERAASDIDDRGLCAAVADAGPALSASASPLKC